VLDIGYVRERLGERPYHGHRHEPRRYERRPCIDPADHAL